MRYVHLRFACLTLIFADCAVHFACVTSMFADCPITLLCYVCMTHLLLRLSSTCLLDLCLMIVIHGACCGLCTLHLAFGCALHVFYHCDLHIWISHPCSHGLAGCVGILIKPTKTLPTLAILDHHVTCFYHMLLCNFPLLLVNDLMMLTLTKLTRCMHLICQLHLLLNLVSVIESCDLAFASHMCQYRLC